LHQIKKTILNTEELFIAALKDEETREAAFSKLVQRYKERLYYHVRRLVINHEDADDVLQETFIKVFKNIQNFKGESQLFTWIYRIATHQALDHLRKQSHMKGIQHQELLASKVEQLHADIYFDGAAAEQQFQKALVQLPERQRLIFNMKYFDDLKFREIAEILDCSEGGLKASYHLAVKKIKHFLDGKA
jgi:RNA polymerase sigma factor (sigma-70 family)